MFKTLRNAWQIPDLRKKFIFTALIMLLYRIGNVIPVPYIDVTTLGRYFDEVLSSTILGLYDAMSAPPSLRQPFWRCPFSPTLMHPSLSSC